MISPTRPLITPSGLTAMKVCSIILGFVRIWVNWKASEVVRRVRTIVVKRRKCFGMQVFWGVFRDARGVVLIPTVHGP
jgi:hypothetical protein